MGGYELRQPAPNEAMTTERSQPLAAASMIPNVNSGLF